MKCFIIFALIALVVAEDNDNLNAESSGISLNDKKQEKRGIYSSGYGSSGLGYDGYNSGLGYGGYNSGYGGLGGYQSGLGGGYQSGLGGYQSGLGGYQGGLGDGGYNSGLGYNRYNTGLGIGYNSYNSYPYNNYRVAGLGGYTGGYNNGYNTGYGGYNNPIGYSRFGSYPSRFGGGSSYSSYPGYSGGIGGIGGGYSYGPGISGSIY